MDYIPIGRRTRLQKSLKINKIVNLSKKREVNNGGKWGSLIDDHDHDDEETCVLIDESDFLDAVNSESFERDLPKKVVGVEKKICNLVNFDDDHDDGYDDGEGKRFMGFDDNKSKMILDDEGDNCIHIDDDSDDDHDHDGYDDHGNDNDGGVDNDNDNANFCDNDNDNDNACDDDHDNDGYGYDDDDEGGGGGGGGGGRRGEEVSNDKFQRRVFEGMYLPKYPKKIFEDSNNFIGKRTRSHYKPMFRRKNFNDGTIKCPISIDSESTSSSSSDEHHDDDDDDDEDEDEEEEEEEEDEHVEEDIKPKTQEGFIGNRKRGRTPLKKVEVLPKRKGRAKKVKVKYFHTMLLNAMLVNDNEGPEVVVSSLSRKFSFGVEDLQQGNSQVDEEVQFLFNDMNLAFDEINFALGANDIGEKTTCLNSDEDEFDFGCDSAIWHEKLCGEGKHYWIHDEEIGIKCKFCAFVNLETRYVMPEFYKFGFGPIDESRYYGLSPNNSDSDGFQFFDDIVNGSRGDDPSSVGDTQGTVWDLIPGLKKNLYPHQREGFEFIWRNLAGGIRVDELNTELTDQSGAGGCLINHAPGTGKTRLATVFMLSFIKQYPKSKPLIIAPCNILRTWEDEFARWNPDIPFFNLKNNEFSEKERLELLKFFPEKKNIFKDEKSVREGKIFAWSRGKGCVLAVNYELFQRLGGYGKGVLHEKLRQVLLNKPDILVMDEGHRPRNENSKSWRVLSEVSTKRRIILSGTPFQNNLDELGNIISLVREDFVGFHCSHTTDGRTIEKVWKQIKGFVHVHHGEVLSTTLKGMHQFLVVLRPSDLQLRLFSIIRRIRYFIKYDHLTSVSSVHPSIICDDQNAVNSFVDEELNALLKRHKMDYKAGVKTRFLVELLKLCKGERVLVFGQYLPPLNFIEDLLKSLFQWTKGREIFYIDGDQDMKERHSSIKHFNDPKSEARVLLASTKACSEGIDLVGASRVVMLDVQWNPSVLRQAICRAYRLGQQRVVFVYHLVALGTLEEKKWRTQAKKEHVSEKLFVCSDGRDSNKMNIGSKEIYEDRVLGAMTHHEKAKDMFEKIIYQPKLGDLMQNSCFPSSLQF